MQFGLCNLYTYAQSHILSKNQLIKAYCKMRKSTLESNNFHMKISL